MALLTAYELQILTSWSLLNDYQKNKNDFIIIGKMIYDALVKSGTPPTGPHDVERFLIVAVEISNIFKTACARKRPHSFGLYHVFAQAIARYILDNEWANITQP